MLPTYDRTIRCLNVAMEKITLWKELTEGGAEPTTNVVVNRPPPWKGEEWRPRQPYICGL